MKISANGIALIKRFEGLELRAYQDIAGVWTIGYGHTGDAAFAGNTIDGEMAEALLKEDVSVYEQGIIKHVKVYLNQNQFDALCSWSFNLGVGALRRSTALKRLNVGDYTGAAHALTWYNKARMNGKLVEITGLVRRRAAEFDLFMTPVGFDNHAHRETNVQATNEIPVVQQTKRLLACLT
ncbi:MAG: lysozyme [Pseudomonadota bacterium]